MAPEHWFDTLNKVLVRDAPRRTLLGAATAAITSFIHGVVPIAEAGKNGNKGKGKGKGKEKGKGNGKKKDRKKDKKDKGKPKLCGADIHLACNAGPLTTSPEDCEDKCARCKKAGTAFCLVPTGDDDDLTRRPTCCYSADDCCGGPVGDCCASDRCCELKSDSFTCLGPGEKCCPSDPDGYCQKGYDCCPGKGCFIPCEPPLISNPDDCSQCVDPNEWCPQNCVAEGLECCRPPGVSWVACVNTHGDDPDPNNCGGCNQPCNRPRWCCPGGICADIRADREHCGFGCQQCSPGQQCCHGRCIDALLECCRDSDFGMGFCSPGRSCCTLPDGSNGCYGQNGCCDGRGNCYR